MGKGTWKPGRHVLGSVNAKLKIPGACRCAAQTGGDESGEGERDVQLGEGGQVACIATQTLTFCLETRRYWRTLNR